MYTFLDTGSKVSGTTKPRSRRIFVDMSQISPSSTTVQAGEIMGTPVWVTNLLSKRDVEVNGDSELL